ncbi:tetratricopeptide repeat protein [Entomospira nematocerorum]|uniref:Tetratricopeptide repeat protein n=1 Tax=Entomospira nematocerorum TaxID=2719987 RepID=A0A968GCW2_9SPIO|nr:tetratricopeptide repeat protein [Entomospira nematocera]NIZ46929.1 tetratricopeptide repeat protein [Entomospira nematocera]WDI33274.1 tetratricopeptide repeat protein [Entomospira nematocera]
MISAYSPYDEQILANPNDAEAYFNRGVYLLEAGENFEIAKEDFIQAISLDFNIADAYSNLALIYDIQEDVGATQTCLEKALEADPTHVVSWYALGTLHAIYGRHEEALSALAKVLEIELDFQEDDEFLEEDFSFAMDAFALRARIYLEMNANDLALAECLASKAFDPDGNECELLEIVALLRLNCTAEAKTILQALQEEGNIERKDLEEHPLLIEILEIL